MRLLTEFTEFSELEKKLSTEFGKPVEIVFKGGEIKEIAPAKDDRIRFIYGATPKGNPLDYRAENMSWNLKLSGEYYNTVLTNMLRGDSSGTVIKDGTSDYGIFISRDNKDFYSYYTFEQDAQKIFLEMIKEAYPKIIEKLPRPLDRAAILEMISKCSSFSTEDLGRQLREVRGNIQSYEQSLVEYYRKEHDLILKLKVQKEYSSEVEKTADEQARELETLSSMYKSIDYNKNENIITAVSKPVAIKDGDKSYDLGSYTIKFNPTYGDYRFTTDKGNVGPYQHPHIEDNVACFGEIGHEVSKLLSKGEIAILLQLLWQYLNSYNSGNTFVHLENFTAENWNNSSWHEIDADDFEEVEE